MANDSSFRLDDDDKLKHTYSRKNHKRNEHTAPYIAWKIIERIYLISTGSSKRSFLYVQYLQVSLLNEPNEYNVQ